MSSLRRCIIWGATGQSKVLFDILKLEGIEVIHLFDNDLNIESSLPGVPISYGTDGIIDFVDNLISQNIDPSEIFCFAAIGGTQGKAREEITLLMESFGFLSMPLVHKSAIVSPSAFIGKSTQILAGSIIGSFASIGDFSTVCATTTLIIFNF